MANLIEAELIKKYNTQDKAYGYNVSAGGNGIHGITGKNNWKSKPIYQYDLKGNFIREWENAQIAAKTLNILVSTIYQSCRGTFDKPKMAGGYIWSYVKMDKMTEYTPAIPYYSEKHPILQINLNFEVVEKYKNIYHIDDTKYNKNLVTDCCKKERLEHKHYYWCYEQDYKSPEEFKKYIYDRIRKNKGTYTKIIYQCDFDGNILNEYVNGDSAEEITGFKCSTILSWCRRNTHGIKTGYIWVYKMDYDTIGFQNIIKDLKPRIDKIKSSQQRLKGKCHYEIIHRTT